MAKSSAMQKLKNQKSTAKPSKKAESKKAKKAASEPEVQEDEEEIEMDMPTPEECKKLKTKELDDLNAALPEEIEGWDEMGLGDKRKAMAQVSESFYAEEEDEDSEEESDEDESEDDSDDEEEQDEVDAELEETSNKVVPIKKSKKEAKASKKEAKADKSAKGVKKAKSKKAGSNNDPIDQAVSHIENLSEEEAFKEAHVLAEDIDYNYFRLGGVLSVIDSKKYFGEYSSFREIVEAEFGLAYRKARYLLEIYNNVIESGVPWEKLQHIGWTKLREISALITEDTVDEWIEKCQSMNTDTLKAEVKAMTKGDAKANKSDKPVSNTTTMTFKLHDDQKENVDEAIAQAMDATGTDSRSVALEHICLDYLAGDTKKKATKQMTTKQFLQKLLDSAKGDQQAAIDALFESKDFQTLFPEIEMSDDEDESDEEEIEEDDSDEDDEESDDEDEEEEDEELDEDEEEEDDEESDEEDEDFEDDSDEEDDE